MKIKSSKAVLSGEISVPGSKSHTIRACILAMLADGKSYIRNPLQSEDCIAAKEAIKLLGAEVEERDNVWIVTSDEKKLHLPTDVVNVRNSGSVMYFLSPVAATFEGCSIFTGDESIRKRPVNHLLDALRQLGADAFSSVPGSGTSPFIIKGPVKSGKLKTDGRLSQYISGIMMASSRLFGKTELELTDPKETPYLTMTQKWLSDVGVESFISDDYRKITVEGPQKVKTFDKIIPSDWEGIAFPLIAALITDSEIKIINVDCSKSQGDAVIVDILKEMGADITLVETDEINHTGYITARGGSKSLLPNKGKLKGVRVNCASIPDAVPALSVIACFAEGKTVLEDIEICRHKETDRIKIMNIELSKLGAKIKESADTLEIDGKSKYDKDFNIHGGLVESYKDHRVAMSLAVLGLGLDEGNVVVNEAECCSVSFPGFFDAMNKMKSGFEEV